MMLGRESRISREQLAVCRPSTLDVTFQSWALGLTPHSLHLQAVQATIGSPFPDCRFHVQKAMSLTRSTRQGLPSYNKGSCLSTKRAPIYLGTWMAPLA